MNKLILATTTTAAMLGFSVISHAGDVNGLASFSAGTPARAAEVNGNFNNVKTAVDDNHARIAELERSNTALYQANATIRNRLTALETLLANVTRSTINGYPTIRFSGVNVQVDNGMGSTATANGTGNLIVGYNEADTSGLYHCSLSIDPSTTPIINATTCTGAGGTWVNTGFKTGSHYIIAGSENNYSSWGGILAGYQNTSSNIYASVTGGNLNTASGEFASVSGGYFNTAGILNSSVSGGANGIAYGVSSSISGGNYNTASGTVSSVSGGYYNTASATGSHVSGGGSGGASGGNTADTNYSSILGGTSQNTSTASQTIPALP